MNTKYPQHPIRPGTMILFVVLLALFLLFNAFILLVCWPFKKLYFCVTYPWRRKKTTANKNKVHGDYIDI